VNFSVVVQLDFTKRCLFR